ncbi:hypothetical protein PMI26_05702 [Pseudomonas sp. GM33]|uniref:hypothetical protein n=1 Tax=Pseudomonas sp. GM33 TaxID=1144329 RepID=UPI00026FF1F1|nr:hypothetical protein [Pseudomonas sp. GM33]EJM34495.1 hypothetical protein PMI26_05702 [Pseudomonas sp. GM33]
MSMHTYGKKGPWDYIQPWDVERLGEDILDEETRQRWSAAFCIAGGLPYIWNELARPISDIMYALLELKPGDKVLILGEGVEPAGWDRDMRALVGPEGVVDTVEIILDGRAKSLRRERGRNGVIGTWEWAYTYDKPNEYYDCVAVMQSTQHCDNWVETSAELLRVMKPGRRIVSAEAVVAGSIQRHRIDSDVHLREWYEKAMGFLPLTREEIPYYSGEDLLEAFGDQVVDARIMEWHGIEMFWARKPGKATV